MEEKKMARRLHLRNRSLISSNCSRDFFSWPKACTTFWFPTISSTKPVCSPRTWDCSRNISYVRLAMKAATSRDTGVMTTTTAVMTTLTLSMKISVPRMVMTPENSWVKPMSRPSANWSTSAMTRLTTSPVGRESMYFRGRIWSLRKASLRMSRTTR